ncbi:hypothetical protein LS684_11130 [Cytobacillus spongiae]|uniref:hypothetical protein n=1 Tax=Cytobacillus spongiae TaxID=2901381 RepID=UPI001F1831BD|nr:hypothetical protein [Cytobacillus spongiae]UII57913.1 hypothetical protein LS684_11130 [Cytobacillus spongiae]
MSLEWFDRVIGELQDNIESICHKYDQQGHMTVERAAKHPRIEFFIESEEFDRDYFCSLHFDPYNEEFYIESFDVDLGYTTRLILLDIEDIIDAVHESLHDLVDFEEVNALELDDEEEEVDELDDFMFEEIDVDWQTSEVTAYTNHEDVEVTYQFGIVQETGDGVLRRLNRIRTAEDELIEDESNFIFSKEEATTIITMIAGNMESLKEMSEN